MNESEKEIKNILEKILALGGESAVLPAKINNVDLFVPARALKMFGHCLFPSPEFPFQYFIETRHLKWLLDHAYQGDCIIDIGASCGFLTAAFSKHVGVQGKVFSFEPAREACKLLSKLIDLNHLENVEHVPFGITNERGKTAFIEYVFNQSNEVAWLPETSSIIDNHENNSDNKSVSYMIDTISIDQFLLDNHRRIAAIKIDIEGYEALALQGAIETLRKWRPALSVDIHKNPFGEGNTENTCRAILAPLGYNLKALDHALVAE